MKLNQKTASALAMGIFAALIFAYFIDPILTLIGRLTLVVSNALYGAYLDRLYAEIATGKPDYSFALIVMILLMLTGMAIGLILVKRTYVRLEMGEKKKEPSERYKQPARGSNSFIIIVDWIIPIFMLLAILFLVGYGYIGLKTVSTFEQHVSVLAPHLSDQTEEWLRAQFASVRNRQDYKVVVETLNELAAEVGVELPENKLYPF